MSAPVLLSGINLGIYSWHSDNRHLLDLHSRMQQNMGITPTGGELQAACARGANIWGSHCEHYCVTTHNLITSVRTRVWFKKNTFFLLI